MNSKGFNKIFFVMIDFFLSSAKLFVRQTKGHADVYFLSFCNFAVPEVDFAVKIREVKAEEREDALFQCVLTAPMDVIKWTGKNVPLTNSDKFEITVSEDKLIHKLIVRDCLPLDAGIYAAVAGIKSCSAWLVVEGQK